MLAALSNGSIGHADQENDELAQLRLQKKVLKKAFLREQALRAVLEDQLAARDRDIAQLLAEVRRLRALSGQPDLAEWNGAINGHWDGAHDATSVASFIEDRGAVWTSRSADNLAAAEQVTAKRRRRAAAAT